MSNKVVVYGFYTVKGGVAYVLLYAANLRVITGGGVYLRCSAGWCMVGIGTCIAFKGYAAGVGIYHARGLGAAVL